MSFPWFPEQRKHPENSRVLRTAGWTTAGEVSQANHVVIKARLGACWPTAEADWPSYLHQSQAWKSWKGLETALNVFLLTFFEFVLTKLLRLVSQNEMRIRNATALLMESSSQRKSEHQPHPYLIASSTDWPIIFEEGPGWDRGVRLITHFTGL